MSVPDTVRHGSGKVIFETYPAVGYNYRMTDIQAAIGREQLKRLPEIVQERRELAAHYGELLAEIPGSELPARTRLGAQQLAELLRPAAGGRGSAPVMQAMLDAASTRRGIMCSHREPAYRNLCLAHALSKSEQAQDRSVLLPLYPGMTPQERGRVARELRSACTPASNELETLQGSRPLRRPEGARSVVVGVIRCRPRIRQWPPSPW